MAAGAGELDVLVRLASIIGAGTLVVLALWGWVLIAAPSVPNLLPGDKTGTAAIPAGPKLRDVTAQPHTTSPPQVVSITPAKPPAKPATSAAPVAAPAPAAAPATSPPPVSVAAPSVVPPPPAVPAPALTTRDIAAVPTTPAPAAPGAEEKPNDPEVAQAAPDPVDDAAPDTTQPAGSSAHSARCQRYRTYNPTTQTYRGFDGVTHPCRAR